MHIPAEPRQTPIVTATAAAGETAAAGVRAAHGELEALLWQALAPERWPLPREALPPGTALVGGAVRDALLGRLRARPDLDLVVSGGAIQLARDLARQQGGTCVVLDRERDMARLVLAGWTIDLARRQGPDLSADLLRRDYSANALALPLAAGGRLLDPTGGLDDLHRGRLVAVSEANLLDDPLRLLRGVRLAWELGLQLDATSLGWIERHAGRLAEVAGERVLAELERLAASSAGHQGLAQALSLGLLHRWGADPAAGIPLAGLSMEAAAERGLGREDAGQVLPLARLATLLPGTAVRLLRGSRRLEQDCSRLRRWWAQLDAGGAGLDGLAEARRLQLQRELEGNLPALLLRLPVTGAREALQHWRDRDHPLYHPRSPLNGEELGAALGLSAGPELGELLQHLTLERAFGRIPPAGGGQRHQALLTARRWLDSRRG
jgi:tRNA nucleotidyltransferase (CCA-adding enzyme)